jgi:hypothetical protein
MEQQIYNELKMICERLGSIEQAIKILNKAVFEDTKNNLLYRVRNLELKITAISVVFGLLFGVGWILKI